MILEQCPVNCGQAACCFGCKRVTFVAPRDHVPIPRIDVDPMGVAMLPHFTARRGGIHFDSPLAGQLVAIIDRIQRIGRLPSVVDR